MAKQKVDLKDVELCDQVEQYLKTKLKSTAATYRGNLKRFRKFLGRPIIEFLNDVDERRSAKKDLPPEEWRRYFEETINEFIEWMQDHGYANNPIRGSLTALQNLFLYYNVPISYRFVKMPPPIARKKNGKHKWRVQDVKKFRDGADNYRDKAIIMVMFQSGMAVNEISNLTYGDVAEQLNSGELPILIDMVREKNSNPFKTLIGADAAKDLMLYLDTRGELKEGDPLFATQIGSEDKIAPDTIQWMFRELAGKIFGYSDDEMNPYRPHSLRAAFRSKLIGKTDTDLIKFWMGDVLGPKAGAYLNLPDEDHKELYKAVEKHLSIETTSKDIIEGWKADVTAESVRVKNLRDQVDQLEREREIDQKELKGMIKNVEELTKMLGDVYEKLGRISDFVEILGYDWDPETGEVGYDPNRDQRIPEDARPLTKVEKEELQKLPINKHMRRAQGFI